MVEGVLGEKCLQAALPEGNQKAVLTGHVVSVFVGMHCSYKEACALVQLYACQVARRCHACLRK